MTLNELIKSTNWFSLELTIIVLHPDSQELIEDYKTVFEKLKQIEPKQCEMEIVLSQHEDIIEDNTETIIEVSARKKDTSSIESFEILEFTEWRKWLGMELANETIENFSDTEIISHCIYEMTFAGFDEKVIQEHYVALKKTVEDFHNLSAEEKSKISTSVEDFLDELNKFEDNPN